MRTIRKKIKLYEPVRRDAQICIDGLAHTQKLSLRVSSNNVARMKTKPKRSSRRCEQRFKKYQGYHKIWG